MKKLLITQEQLQNPASNQTNRYQVCAFCEDNRMIEVNLCPADTESILNNIYIAKVKNVVANLNAAFVEIGKGQTCYLPLENLKKPLFIKKVSAKTIAAGEELVVQVVKEAMKTKDAVVTTNLSFPGEYLVLTSADRRIGISSKIHGEGRVRLQTCLQTLLGGSGQIPEDFGLILRTNAAQADESMLQAEFLQLKAEYDKLKAHAFARTAYSCLRKERPFYLKMLMDLDKSDLDEVITDVPDIYEHLKQELPGSCSLRFYDDSLLPLPRLYNLAGQLEAALKPRVWLKSGANIVIQPTEALTVIDVNSGKNTAKKEKKQNHYKINLEAAREIAFQLRLRNISGIILVDFIDLYDDALNEELMEELRAYLKQDPVPTNLIDITKLGLVEITRKKQKKPLAEQFFSGNARK